MRSGNFIVSESRPACRDRRRSSWFFGDKENRPVRDWPSTPNSRPINRRSVFRRKPRGSAGFSANANGAVLTVKHTTRKDASTIGRKLKRAERNTNGSGKRCDAESVSCIVRISKPTAAKNWLAYREKQQAEAALQQNSKQTVSHE